MPTDRTIVLAGSLAQKPGKGGHTWVFLQYLLGFRRLGWDVLFLDRLEPEMCVDERGMPCAIDRSANVRYLRDVLGRFGLADSYSVACSGGSRFLGLPKREVLARTADAALLINVMGFFDDEDVLARAPRRVFLDIDPGFPQMWRALGLHDPFAGHDDFVTVGANIGRPGCVVPTCGLPWLTTRPPVVLEHWRPREPSGPWFTSVGTWRGAYGPVSFEGTTYGLRVHEFRRFADLPKRSGAPFMLALDVQREDRRDADLLRNGGWRLVDPRLVAADPDSYRAFIRRSRAEFMVAKEMYVKGGSGWFSDRSACYLASGKPVLAQNTELEGVYPTGKGLLLFDSQDDVLDGIRDLRADYEGHASAARRLAEEYFDSDLVLGDLLESLGVAS